jgi:hypothetical protein
MKMDCSVVLMIGWRVPCAEVALPATAFGLGYDVPRRVAGVPAGRQASTCHERSARRSTVERWQSRPVEAPYRADTNRRTPWTKTSVSGAASTSTAACAITESSGPMEWTRLEPAGRAAGVPGGDECEYVRCK